MKELNDYLLEMDEANRFKPEKIEICTYLTNRINREGEINKKLKYSNQKLKKMAKIDFGGVLEDVVTRDEFSLSRAREVLKNEIVAVIGYGVQGPAQALNMKDNGINVIIGQAPEFKADWDKAVSRWICSGENLVYMLKRQQQKER